ncbi:MAG: O-antigen ligase family protein [Ruminococcaceae bacterium]|nr:O-antigen ligase family protein [Oscillospiraceae bacterium]
MKLKRLIGKDGLPFIDFAAIIFFSLYYILPSFSGSFNRTLVLFLGIGYFLYVLLKDRKIGVSFISIFTAVTVIAFAFLLLTETKTVAESASNRLLKVFMSKFSQYFFMYLPGLFLIRVLKNANKEQKNALLMLLLVLYIIVLYNTFIVVLENPDAVRSWENFSEMEAENIGNYYFVYSVPIIITGLSVCMARLKGFKKFFCLGFIFVLFVFLLLASYTLAVLIAVLGLILQVFLSLKSPVTKILFIIAAVIALFFVPDLLLFISENAPSGNMAIRFKELYSFFTSGDSSGYNLNGRLTLYRMSIEAFLNSPIIGNRNLDFDGHATFLTVLADTGIIGGIPFYYLLFSMNKRMKAFLNENARNFIPAFFSLLLMGFTNPIHNSLPLAFAVWFIVPLIINALINKEGEKVK